MAITRKLVSFVCIFICTCFTCSVVAGNATRCCENGFYMNVNGMLDMVYCRNNITKVEQPSALKCNRSAMFNEKQLFFNVSDEGDVIIWQEWGPEVRIGFCVGEVNSKLKGVDRFVVRRAAATCIDEEETLVDPMIKSYCSLVSVAFLYVTAVIYGALPELRDVEGKSIVNLCGSLSTGLLIIAIQNLSYGSLDSIYCWIHAFLGYFLVIAAFFWMNAISVQILRNMSRPVIPNYSWKEFLWYFVYAWGTAAVLTVLAVVLDAVEGSHIKPGIGRTSCWFYNFGNWCGAFAAGGPIIDLCLLHVSLIIFINSATCEIWIYVYSVILVLIIVNTSIFVYISMAICRSTFTSDHMRAWRYKFCMMLRLYVIMGVPWILEMISGSVQAHFITSIIDIMNSLVGLLFFLVLVVLRLRVIKSLQERKLLCCMTSVAERFLADAEDHEAKAIAHTAVMSLDETRFK